MQKIESAVIQSAMLELKRDVETALESADRKRLKLQGQVASLEAALAAQQDVTSSKQDQLLQSERELARVTIELAHTHEQVESLGQQLRQVQHELAQMSFLREELVVARERGLRLENQLDRSRGDLAELARYARELEVNLRDVLESQSWKLTAILRRINVIVQRLLVRRRIQKGASMPTRPVSLERVIANLEQPAGRKSKRTISRERMTDAAVVLGQAVAEQLCGLATEFSDAGKGIQFPTDAHRLARQGDLLPRYGVLRDDRKFPSGYPFELLLPEPVGNKNDYRFLLDAIDQQASQLAIPDLRLEVIAWLRDEHDMQAIGEALHLQTLPRNRFGITVLVADEANLPKQVSWADRTIQGNPWQAELGELVDTEADGESLLLFMDGTFYPDVQLLERVVRHAAVSDRMVLGVAGVQVDKAGFTNLYSRTGFRRDWIKERFPFRNLQSFNFAVRANLFITLGGFESRFQDYRKAVMEFGYRVYNRGTYFLPLGAAKRRVVAPLPVMLEEESRREEEELFAKLCPVHWYRPDDGRYPVPKVSIYIPAYNAAPFICSAIDSVLEQDFEDLEVCVHVDGSPDDTLRVLEQTYSDDERVRWSVDENAGIAHASNRAISLARGLYVGQLDSDDRLKPGAVRALAEFLDEHGDIGCVYSSCERVDENGNYLQDEYSWPTFSHEKMMMTSIVHHFRMFRRQAWERTEKFRESIRNAVDYDMFLKLSEITRMHHIERSFYQRRWHGGNTSSVNEALQTENTYVVQNASLERQGLGDTWEVAVRDPREPRVITYRRSRAKTRLFYWPDYSKANPYQRLLYRQSLDDCDVYAGDIQAALKAARDANDPENLVFHIHWLNPLVQGAESLAELRQRLESFLDDVRSFRALGGRVIWTVHNVLSHDSEHAEIERQFSSDFAAMADRIHVHAAASIREISESFDLPEERVVVSRHGSYLGVYPNIVPREVARHQFGLAPEDRALLFFGQIRPYKGLGGLIESSASQIRHGRPVRLIIAGRANYDVRRQIRASGMPPGRVQLIDRHIDDSELQLLFQAADVGVFPYTRILTSGSLMLSLSFGLPAIVPAVGMTREVLEGKDAGLLFGPGASMAELDDALNHAMQLMDQDEWTPYRHRAAALAAELDWPDFIGTALSDQAVEDDEFTRSMVADA